MHASSINTPQVMTGFEGYSGGFLVFLRFTPWRCRSCVHGPLGIEENTFHSWHYKVEDHRVNFIHRLAYVGFDLELSDKASCDFSFNLSLHPQQPISYYI